MDQDKQAITAEASAEAPEKAVKAKKKEEKSPIAGYLTLGIVGLLVAALMLFLGIKTILDQRLDTFDHSDVWDGYAQMDIVMLSDPFYERSDGATVHMAIDKNMSINVICVSDEQLEQLQPVTTANLKDDLDALRSVQPISLQGRHKAIPDSMRHDLVDAYNTMMDTDDMNYGRSMKVMGALYLDATEPPTTRSPWLYLLLGGAVAALSLYFVIYASILLRRRRSRSGHTTKEDPRLARYDVRVGYEVQSGIALTAHAVVDLSDKESLPVLIPFSKILWIYSSRKRVSLGSSRQTIVLALSDGTQREVAALPTAGAGNQIYLEIFSDIRDRIPGVLVGYSDENQAAYQEKVKALESEGRPEEDDAELDLLPEGDGHTNQITGEWQEGEDILPEGWDPDAVEEAIEAQTAEAPKQDGEDK